MNPFRKAKRRSGLTAEDGQMAIFIALIFQVLFVFFAMVVNIGLIVHDKINLQNAVDLGAYYGAQRQAEILNEIAHINYQIRQDYKLLSWRTRVLGNIGNNSASHGRSPHPQWLSGPQPESPYEESTFPGLCVANANWEEITSTENRCLQRPDEGEIPEIPPVAVLPLAHPFSFAVQAMVNGFREDATRACDQAGPLNWAFTANIYLAFKRAVFLRKQMIRNLALNVSSRLTSDRNESFRDQEMNPVFDGIQKTIFKNLTIANRVNFQLEAYNGLENPVCATPDPVFPFWIREILIDPALSYTNFRSGGGCRPLNTFLMFIPGTVGPNGQMVPGGANYRVSLDPTGMLAELARDQFHQTDFMYSSRGFEKNPWCMAYIGVKATTRPRKPFAPFGAPITLTARSFAAPFGGRIGPWDKKGWPRGSAFSASGDDVDPLAVPRTLPGVAFNRGLNPRFIPNYSRFPGDQLGLRSKKALAATRPALAARLVGRSARKLTLDFFRHFQDFDVHGDPLAWDNRANEPTFLRQAETSAITPDLFDATYYSIEPDFARNYFRFSLQRTRFNQLPLISDLGTRQSVQSQNAYTIRDQIRDAFEASSLESDTYWAIRSPEHLLTGWAQKGVDDYGFPEQYFGKCIDPAPGSGQQLDPPNPGDCVIGGRTGYSVRFVHRDYLNYENHPLGGIEGSAPLLNPPPETF